MMATDLLIASLNCAEAEEKGKTERLEGGWVLPLLCIWCSVMD
jgi:hypothetical protein